MGCLLQTPPYSEHWVPKPTPLGWYIIREELVPRVEGVVPRMTLCQVFGELDGLARRIRDGECCPQTLAMLRDASPSEFSRHQTLAMLAEILESRYTRHLEHPDTLFINETQCSRFLQILVSGDAPT